MKMRRLLHATALCSALALEAPGRVTLVSGKARLFKNGNPLVFSGAVKRVEPKGLQAGDIVDVVDGADKLLGWGVYNPHSMYRVRLLASDEPALLEHRDMGDLMAHRIRSAAAVRDAACLPSEETTAYRLINGEGDRLSGLMVDVFDGTAVVVSSALWLERYRDEVSAAISALPTVNRLEWRRSEARLKKDGWEPSEEGAEAEAAAAEAAAEAPVCVKENGLQYHVDVFGQKSGFYCDQVTLTLSLSLTLTLTLTPASTATSARTGRRWRSCAGAAASSTSSATAVASPSVRRGRARRAASASTRARARWSWRRATPRSTGSRPRAASPRRT